MAAYRADRQQEYGVTNWKIGNAAVLYGTTICLHYPKMSQIISENIFSERAEM